MSLLQHMVDYAIVGSAVGGAGVWFVKRLVRPAAGCKTSCGGCVSTPKPSSDLVQLRGSLARDRSRT